LASGQGCAVRPGAALPSDGGALGDGDCVGDAQVTTGVVDVGVGVGVGPSVGLVVGSTGGAVGVVVTQAGWLDLPPVTGCVWWWWCCVVPPGAVMPTPLGD